jgi:hypothetical protein
MIASVRVLRTLLSAKQYYAKSPAPSQKDTTPVTWPALTTSRAAPLARHATTPFARGARRTHGRFSGHGWAATDATSPQLIRVQILHKRSSCVAAVGMPAHVNSHRRCAASSPRARVQVRVLDPNGVGWLPRYGSLIAALTTKTFCKRLRLRTDCEVHRHNNRVFVLIVSVARGLAPISFEPFAHRNNCGRKILTG